MKNKESLQRFLENPKDIVITTHRKPDGDALGSSLALQLWLEQSDHRVHVISPTDFPAFLAWLPKASQILDFSKEKDKEQINRLMHKADGIFCLDFNNLSRINELGSLVAANQGFKAMIDHHPQPDDFAEFVFSKVTASSTAELIFELIEEFNDLKSIDTDIATCIYTGMVTDTGMFQYPATTPRVLRIAAFLLEKGVAFTEIINEVFNSFSAHRLQLFGFALYNRLLYYPEFKTAYIFLSRKDAYKYYIQTGDTEGLVNYPLKIRDVRFSALIVEHEEIIKISFRSIGDFNVNEFARKHFEGGGHVNAAGGISRLSLEETMNKFKNLLPQYKHLLIN